MVMADRMLQMSVLVADRRSPGRRARSRARGCSSSAGTNGIGRAIADAGARRGAPRPRSTGRSLGPRRPRLRGVEARVEAPRRRGSAASTTSSARPACCGSGRSPRRTPPSSRRSSTSTSPGRSTSPAPRTRTCARRGGSLTVFASSSFTRGRPDYVAYSREQGGRREHDPGPGRGVGARRDPRQRREPGADRHPDAPARVPGRGPDGMLGADDVAVATLRLLRSDLTGQVVDVRRHDDCAGLASSRRAGHAPGGPTAPPARPGAAPAPALSPSSTGSRASSSGSSVRSSCAAARPPAAGRAGDGAAPRPRGQPARDPRRDPPAAPGRRRRAAAGAVRRTACAAKLALPRCGWCAARTTCGPRASSSSTTRGCPSTWRPTGRRRRSSRCGTRRARSSGSAWTRSAASSEPERTFLHRHYDWVVTSGEAAPRAVVAGAADAASSGCCRWARRGPTACSTRRRSPPRGRGLLAAHPALAGRRVVLYAPTFRGRGARKTGSTALDAGALRALLPADRRAGPQVPPEPRPGGPADATASTSSPTRTRT